MRDKTDAEINEHAVQKVMALTQKRKAQAYEASLAAARAASDGDHATRLRNEAVSTVLAGVYSDLMSILR